MTRPTLFLVVVQLALLAPALPSGNGWRIAFHATMVAVTLLIGLAADRQQARREEVP